MTERIYTVQKKLSSLPEELLMKIFGFLPYSDLSAMMIVNKKFNNLANDPALWMKYPVPAGMIIRRYWFGLSETPGIDILLKVLELSRFSRLEVLDLRYILPVAIIQDYSMYVDFKRWEEFKQKLLKVLEMASALPLKSLNLSFNDFKVLNLSPPCLDLLVKMVLNIKHVQLNSTYPPQGLFEKILDGVSVTSVLSSIDLGDCNLAHLPTSSIVKLSCLSEVSLEDARMSEGQARALIMEMGKGTNIKKFDMGSGYIIDMVTYGDVLDTVEPEIVAKALTSVEYVRYYKTDLRGNERIFVTED